MNIWLLLLTLFNIILLTGLSFSLFLRIKEKKQDQRLTKGLQLLQNKISILEDLSDRTDEQVGKIVHLIDQKAQDVRTQLMTADQKIEQINMALSKALDISKVFSENIPQQEIVDRQKTNAYVQAAKLAHQGFSVDQICAKVDLSPAEVEMIAKVNRDQLQFAEEALPSWVNLNQTPIEKKSSALDSELQLFAQSLHTQNEKLQQVAGGGFASTAGTGATAVGATASTTTAVVAETAFDSLKQDMHAQQNLRNEFKKTVQTVPQNFVEGARVGAGGAGVAASAATASTHSTAGVGGKTIRPFEFRKIVSERK